MIRGKIEYKCPTCGKRVSVLKNEDLPTRPFCCERCKMVDLYKWFNEEYYISAMEMDETDRAENYN